MSFIDVLIVIVHVTSSSSTFVFFARPRLRSSRLVSDRHQQSSSLSSHFNRVHLTSSLIVLPQSSTYVSHRHVINIIFNPLLLHPP
ncbi:hypothetical protein BV898_18862, partial [Hypsibius exemplaris]